MFSQGWETLSAVLFAPRYQWRSGKIAQRIILILLVILLVFLASCGKVAIKEPVYLPGLGPDKPPGPTKNADKPLFNNGDIVRYKMLPDKVGIMMKSDYQYLSDLDTWFCIVDFYPSSALIHFDFSAFDNYERRYVYEFELELVERYSKKPQVPARWKSMSLFTD